MKGGERDVELATCTRFQKKKKKDNKIEKGKIMRIFFLNPSADERRSLGIYRILSSPAPPLWAGYLISIAKEYTSDIKVIDNNIEKLGAKELVDEIKNFSPDILCISVLTQTATLSYKIAKAVREVLPKTKIVMGGPHASYFAIDLVKRGIADAVVIGEGEETFNELLKNYSRKEFFVEKGAVFRYDGQIIISPERERISELDKIKFPSWEFFRKYFRYYKTLPPNEPKTPVLTFLASRGCPYNCTFCMVQMGRTYKIRSPWNICNELEYFSEEFGCKHFWFVDPLFPPPSKKKGLEILSEMARKLKGITWDCETRADLIDEEIAEALKESGCELVAIGIESGDNQVLDSINKKIRKEQIERAIKILKKFRIRVMGLYMVGNPGETTESFLRTIWFARKLGTDAAKFSITVPYPGTDIWEKYVKDKYRFSDEDWEKFSSYQSGFPYKMEWTYIPENKIKLLQFLANLFVNMRAKTILIFWKHIFQKIPKYESLKNIFFQKNAENQ